MIVMPGVQIIESDFLLSPSECALLLLLVSLGVLAVEWRRRTTWRLWDAGLMLLTGVAGCVLTVMIFSQHPATSMNLQLLLVNPVHLFFIPSVLRNKPIKRYWIALLTMCVGFGLGSMFQDYAEGMMILALCLLLRDLRHYNDK